MSDESNPNIMPPEGDDNTQNQSEKSPELPPEKEQNSQNQSANDSPENQIENHRLEAKVFLFLALWIFADVLAIFGHLSVAVWDFYFVLIAALGLFTYHATKGWPSQRKTFMRLFAFCAFFLPVALFIISYSPAQIDASGNPIGLLEPANDPMPDEIKKAFPNRVGNESFLIFGDNVAVINNEFSIMHAINYHRINFLKIERIDNKAFVSGDFFDKNGHLVAIIETNNFTLNRLNFFRKFSDKSTLDVFDQDNMEVLNIRFSRPNVFRIKGRIRLPNSSEVIITDTNLIYKNWVMDHNSSVGNFGLNIEDKQFEFGFYY